MTSRRPPTTGIFNLKDRFWEQGKDFTTISQYFKRNGYKSIGAGKIYHYNGAGGDSQYRKSWDHFHHAGRPWKDFINPGPIRGWRAVSDQELNGKVLKDQQVARIAKNQLRQLAPDALSGKKPFFLAVGFEKPHLPWIFPEKYLNYYPWEDVPLPPNPNVTLDLPQAAYFDSSELRNYIGKGFDIPGE